ncbi:dihydroxyacetone kinase DhaL subunit [Ruaniaceae bacterium KH17]|nr:dihydroxyacetone kinase DhaL subunit [Ruaniaceae bacterium KH17]
MSLDVEWGEAWLRRTAEVIAEHRMELIELDRAIGDADHGENMDRGFSAVVARLAPTPDLASLLKTAATTLMSTVGGAAGPLYGTAFLRVAQAVEAIEDELTGSVVAEMFQQALTGVQARGKAHEGEKTMVDALAPAARSARAAADAGASAAGVFRAAAEGAAAGCEATIPMIATKGRASYLGERSAGHMDPGARSTYLILQAGADVAKELA